MTGPSTRSFGLSFCAACGVVLTAAIQDPDWPGLCQPCVHTGAGPLHVLRYWTAPGPPIPARRRTRRRIHRWLWWRKGDGA